MKGRRLGRHILTLLLQFRQPSAASALQSSQRAGGTAAAPRRAPAGDLGVEPKMGDSVSAELQYYKHRIGALGHWLAAPIGCAGASWRPRDSASLCRRRWHPTHAAHPPPCVQLLLMLTAKTFWTGWRPAPPPRPPRSTSCRQRTASAQMKCGSCKRCGGGSTAPRRALHSTRPMPPPLPPAEAPPPTAPAGPQRRPHISL